MDYVVMRYWGEEEEVNKDNNSRREKGDELCDNWKYLAIITHNNIEKSKLHPFFIWDISAITQTRCEIDYINIKTIIEYIGLSYNQCRINCKFACIVRSFQHCKYN